VGVDVSKARLDVAVRPSGESFAEANDKAAVGRVVKRLKALVCRRVVIEATGGYESIVVGALYAAGVPVVVVNPRRVRHFAKVWAGWKRPTVSMPGCWRCMPNGPSSRPSTRRMRRPAGWPSYAPGALTCWR
jgi:transposase